MIQYDENVQEMDREFIPAAFSQQELEYAGQQNFKNAVLSPDGISFDMVAMECISFDDSTTEIRHRITLSARKNDMDRRMFRLHVDTFCSGNGLSPRFIDGYYDEATLKDMFDYLRELYA